MTYTVSGGALNSTQTKLRRHHLRINETGFFLLAECPATQQSLSEH